MSKMKMVAESEQLSGTLLEEALKDFSKVMNSSVMASGSKMKFEMPEMYKDTCQWWKVKITLEWEPMPEKDVSK